MRAAAVSRGHSGSPVRALARLLAWAVQTALLLAIVACALMCLAGWQMYREAAAAKSLEERVEAVRSREGYTTIDQLPEFYLDAVVAAEDHRFWSHSGVDVLATARAAWNDLKSWSLREGGSTITQQLAKNLCFTQEKRFTRKIAEVFAALRLERMYSKEELLELYVNSIYFGEGCWCVGDACRTYFGKEPAEMTEGECALLAGIPNAPSVYNPSASPELARQRLGQVVRQMIRRGMLTEEDGQALIKEAPALS